MAIRFFNFRSTRWMGKSKQNFIKLSWKMINAVLFDFNGPDRTTDDIFSCVLINSQGKSLCLMKHILLLSKLMKAHVNMSSVDQSGPLKSKSIASIVFNESLIKFCFHLPHPSSLSKIEASYGHKHFVLDQSSYIIKLSNFYVGYVQYCTLIILDQI